MKGWVFVGCSLLGAVVFASACAELVSHIAGPRPQLRPTSAPRPFTSLEAAIAAEGWHPAWVVDRQPNLPGPFRVVGLTFTIGDDPIYQEVVWHRDAVGNRAAPIELRGRSGFYQMAVHLETTDGRITGAVLKRPAGEPHK
jgi:hypothetical protein